MPSFDPQDIILKAQISVQEKEARRLAEPEYSGIYNQHFETVASSVEHVISELLQNADDAGAEHAKINFEDGCFSFQHDGSDFEAEQFLALCSFSVSSKHTIKTTGFRGIGFKSTFSLGDVVEVLTPRFQVLFRRSRFTFPEVIDAKADQEWRVTIRIKVKEWAKRELEASIEKWKTAPCSLLFFHKLGTGSLTIGEDTFQVKEVKGTETRQITKNSATIWSGKVISRRHLPLPEDVRTDIASLRGFAVEESALKETQLDLLLDKKEAGRVYSVLPTSGNKRLDLDFAVNGPFVLTPDRDGIKSPSQSATNRFLFEETGSLVVEHLIKKLSKKNVKTDELKEAYLFLPLSCKPGSDPKSAATEIVVESCINELKSKSWILTADTERVRPDEYSLLALPEQLMLVWDSKTLAAIFQPDSRVIDRAVPPTVIKFLKGKGQVKEPSKSELLSALRDREMPRPDTLEQLFELWVYCAEAIQSFYPRDEDFTKGVETWKGIRIFPVKGRNELVSVAEVVRPPQELMESLASKNLKLEDFGLYSLDLNFVPADTFKPSATLPDWWRLLLAAELIKEQSVGHTLSRISVVLSKLKSEAGTANLIRLIWDIYRDWDLKMDDDLPILRQNGAKVSLSKCQLLLSDSTSVQLTSLLSDDFFREHGLAEEWYPADVQARIKFNRWLIEKGQANYLPMPQSKQSREFGYRKLENYLKDNKRSVPYIKYANSGNYFYIDFVNDSSVSLCWIKLCEGNKITFCEILESILKNLGKMLNRTIHVVIKRMNFQPASPIVIDPLLPSSWVNYFAEKPCMPDTEGRTRHPRELYVLNDSTRPLIDAGEPQLRGDWQGFSLEVLSALGCKLKSPSLSEITKLVDGELRQAAPKPMRMLHLLKAVNVAMPSPIQSNSDGLVALLLRHESIPSADLMLRSPEDLAQESEDGDSSSTVHPSLKGTRLASVLSIPQFRGREQELEWLKGLPCNQALPIAESDKLKRRLTVPSSLSEHLFEKLRRWPSLDGQLRSIDELDSWHQDDDEGLSARKITSSRLKSRTADFNLIKPPSDRMKAFGPRLTDRLSSKVFSNGAPKLAHADWLEILSQVLWSEAERLEEDRRADLESVAKRLRVTKVQLDHTLCRRFSLNLEAISDSIPVEAAWVEEKLYVRASDEDEICEHADAIAKEIKATVGACKAGSKLGHWIAREPATIFKLGCKLLECNFLRPWDDSEDKPSQGELIEADSSSLAEKEGNELAKPSPSTEISVDTGGVKSGGQVLPVGGPSSVLPENLPTRGRPTDQTSPEGGHSSYPKQPVNLDKKEVKMGDRSDGTNGGTDRPKEGFRQGQYRMLSYVETDKAQQEREGMESETKAAGDAAEELVLGWEKQHGRQAHRMETNHPGYDIESTLVGGSERRFIEVKSIAGEWGGEGVKLSATQFNHAEQLKDEYWLYVVEHTKSQNPVVHEIQNPAARIVEFCFDSGWKLVAKARDFGSSPSGH